MSNPEDTAKKETNIVDMSARHRTPGGPRTVTDSTARTGTAEKLNPPGPADALSPLPSSPIEPTTSFPGGNPYSDPIPPLEPTIAATAGIAGGNGPDSDLPSEPLLDHPSLIGDDKYSGDLPDIGDMGIHPTLAVRPGNYIFTVGKAGSGKSTLQSHLLRYLMTSGDHLVSPDIEFASDNITFQQLEAEWQNQWMNNEFPQRSTAGKATEFRFNVQPTQKKHPPMTFGFLEISGEDFETLLRTDQTPKLMPSIDEFLDNPHVNVSFLFVCQGKDMKGDDMLFSRFLNYLDLKIKRSYHNNCSAVLVLSDPVTCQRRLAAAVKETYDGRPLEVERFIDLFIPMTRTQLARFGDRALIALFSVGKVGKGQNAEGRPVSLILEPDFDDAKSIYEWLYERFTNRKLGPGFFAKTVGWLKKLGGDEA